ncbi:MAG TPA: hypothetical protein VFZ74_16335, partial [Burkholderiales bacterium]
MGELGSISIAVAVTLLLGFSVEWMLNRSIPQPVRPNHFDEATWNAMYARGGADKRGKKRRGGGAAIGIVERLICLMSIYSVEYIILGGYLTFKVAAKWEAWQNVVQVPSELRASITPAD